MKDYIREYIEKKQEKVKRSYSSDSLNYARIDRLGIIFDPNLPSVPSLAVNVKAIKFVFYRYSLRKMVCKCEQPHTQEGCQYDPNQCKLNVIIVFEPLEGDIQGAWMLKTSRIASLQNLYEKRDLRGPCRLITYPVEGYFDTRVIDIEPLEASEEAGADEEIELNDLEEEVQPITEKTRRLLLSIPSQKRIEYLKRLNKQKTSELTEGEGKLIIEWYKQEGGQA